MFRYSSLLLLAALPLPAANFVVCNSTSETLHDGQACVYTTVATAITAALASPSGGRGDTILLKAGQTFGQFDVKNGVEDLVIKSSKIDLWPRGTRITRTDPANPAFPNPYLARIGATSTADFTLRIGEDFRVATPSVGSTAAFSLTSGGNPHGYTPGDEVIMSSSLTTPFYCESLNVAPFGTADCPVDHVDKFVLRTTGAQVDPQFRDGEVLEFWQAKNVPAGLALHTPYYVRDFIYARDVTQIVDSASVATVTTALPHDRIVGDPAIVVGVTGDVDLNRTYVIATVPSTTTFTVASVNVTDATYNNVGITFNTGFAHFRFSLTSGGVAIPALADGAYTKLDALILAYAAYPNPPYGHAYIASTPTNNTATLEIVPNGTTYDWPQVPMTYTGAGFFKAVQFWRPEGAPRNITLDGLEVTSDIATDPYALIWVFPGKEPVTESNGIRVLRSWVHGHDDQDSFPIVGIHLACQNCEVRDSIVEHIFSRSADTQAIPVAQTTGPVLIENTFLMSTGQSLMTNGAGPNYIGRKTRGITLKRNHSFKPLKWFNGIGAFRTDANNFTLKTIAGASTCSSVAANVSLILRCWWNYGTERYQSSVDLTFNFTGGSSAGFGIVYAIAGQLYFRHNNGTGTWICPASVDCAFMASPALPDADAPRLAYITTLSNGTIDAGPFFTNNTAPWLKNHFESKDGDNWLIEGNVMENQIVAHNGGIQQNMCVNITNSAGGGTTASHLASSSEILIQNNICRNSAEGFLVNGQGFDSVRDEFDDQGYSGGGLVRNNLMYDIGSKRNNIFSSDIGDAFRSQNNRDWTYSHNTIVDVSKAANLNGDGALPCCRQFSYHFLSNIFVPWLGTDQTAGALEIPQVMGTGFTSWNAGYGNLSRAIDVPAVMGVVAVTGSNFHRNMLFNRNNQTVAVARADYPAVGSNYPASTHLVVPADAGNEHADLPNLFETFVERSCTGLYSQCQTSYAANNYRVKPAAAVLYATHDGAVIGADIDELEAIVGPHGADVVAGIPQFSVRTNRVIAPAVTTADLSYIPTETACTIKVWNTPLYSGTAGTAPVVDTTELSGSLFKGRITLTLTGLTTNTTYYGKRWCGNAVDVFSFKTL